MTSVRTDDEIRSEVQKHYGSRVQDTLDAADQLEIVSAGAASCCETTAEDACCGSEGSAEDAEKIAAIASRLYGEGEVDDLPSTVTDVSFGCGNPTAISALTVGQTVLDLGSGGGIDVFLAAKMVGDTGRVYGVDMTPNMIDLARSNAKKVGAENVEFRLGEIERLPIDSDTVDVIISNCVINLSPDKDVVFAEAFRVLRPGGRLQVSDIVWTKPVPDSVKGDMEAWAGCTAGALLEDEYLGKIRDAGFANVTSKATEYDERKGLASAAVVAEKPANLEDVGGCGTGSCC